MKFAILKEQRDYFQKQGWIEFEDILSPDQLIQFNQSIDRGLAKRAACPLDKVEYLSAEQQFQYGRDLWRTDEQLKKMVCLSRFAELGSELVEKRPIRLGYDQIFPSRPEGLALKQGQSVYGQFLNQVTSLEQISCVDQLLFGLMICLTPQTEESISDATYEGVNVFPMQPGHAIFFQPQAQIHLSHLYRYPGQRFYLIVYTQTNAHYYLQPQDPHTYDLKHLGYIFYDLLKDKLNPVVLR